jgi:hypothetical protein
VDAERFGALIRRVTNSRSRRAILGIGFTHLLALLGTPSSVAKKRKKKCKKKCGPCEKRTKGKCRNTASGKEACGGKCVPACLTSPELVVVRNPLTCECCVANGQQVPSGVCLAELCCSGPCSSLACVGIEQGGVCAFDAQCESGSCVLGECA